MQDKLIIQLFVAGRSMRSDVAIDNLRAFLAQTTTQDYDLAIVDVLDDPQAAEDAFVLATPTLIKLSPLPVRRTIGDLTDRESLLRALDLRPDNTIGKVAQNDI